MDEEPEPGVGSAIILGKLAEINRKSMSDLIIHCATVAATKGYQHLGDRVLWHPADDFLGEIVHALHAEGPKVRSVVRP